MRRQQVQARGCSGERPSSSSSDGGSRPESFGLFVCLATTFSWMIRSSRARLPVGLMWRWMGVLSSCSEAQALTVTRTTNMEEGEVGYGRWTLVNWAKPLYALSAADAF